MELSLSKIILVRLDVLLHSLKSVVASNQRITQKVFCFAALSQPNTQTQDNTAIYCDDEQRYELFNRLGLKRTREHLLVCAG